MYSRFCVLVLTLTGVGCTVPVTTNTRPSDYYSPGTQIAEQDVVSLFASDSAVMPDEAIAKALQHRYTVPALSRIALMPIGREAWSSWSEELALAAQNVKADVIDKLLSSPQVYDVAYLPSILVPQQKTVPLLRQAAARYQADLLLIYQSACRNFERYRLFAADESRSHCAVEAVLLDTRTGLVPFTSVVMETFEARQSEADISFQETVLKAQLEAQARALATITGELKAFIADNQGSQSADF